jgi:riboflavin kinase/FMN adenylyltransferase
MSTLTLGRDDYAPPPLRGGAVTVGNFDGVHRGHRYLVSAARSWAQRLTGPCLAVTFDPPPGALLYPESPRPPLTTLTDRAELLHAAGADHVVILRTDPGLLALTPEAFFEDVILRQLAAQAIIEGHDFRFGRARLGDTTLLRELCQHHRLGFETLPPLTDADGRPVSSSRVRAALVAGDVAAAAELLGRPYRITGTVVGGARRGRTIGFPTANLDGVDTLVPGVGVYAVRAEVDGTPWPAAANVGPNPTFGEDARKIEVHLLDFSSDLYGKRLAVSFIARLRDTKPFAGPGELAEQLQQDIAAARRLLS